MGDLLHYLAPLAALAALVVYSQIAKQNIVPKPIYHATLIAGGFLLMALLRV